MDFQPFSLALLVHVKDNEHKQYAMSTHCVSFYNGADDLNQMINCRGIDLTRQINII